MEDRHLDILSKNVLNYIKKYIRDNYVTLERKREKEIDKKVLEIIKDNNINLDIYNKDDMMSLLMQCYVAIYYDNLELLDYLLDEEFSFGNFKHKDMSLFVLDKRISSKFNKEEYINIVKKDKEIFLNFYRSLYNNKDCYIKKEEIIDRFCNIIKNKDKNNNNFGRLLLTVDLLNNFTEEEIFNLTEEQKYNLVGFKNDGEVSLFKLELIKKYNFSKRIIFWNDFMEYFTLEEMVKLTEDDISLIEELLSSNYGFNDSKYYEMNAISVLKVIKEIDPSFNTRLSCVVYDILSKEQIMSMSLDCANKINNLCSNYVVSKVKTNIDLEIYDGVLRRMIKDVYYKDFIKRNVKRLVKRK